MPEPIKKIVIAGGGTAGWMTAAWFSSLFKDNPIEIVLIESDEIGIVGVGEATIPYIHHFNAFVGLDENAFLKATRGTFKLGIEFVDWGKLGHTYHHSFGTPGLDVAGLPFHSVWLRHVLENGPDDLDNYNLQTLASQRGKFMRPQGANSPLANIAYAFHFDASLYAAHLRALCEAHGVRRMEGRINTVNLTPDGFIDSLNLEEERSITGDLFIDCTGFRSLLLGGALGVDFIDWSHWLPCDRALAVPTRRQGAPASCTRATAKSAGWQWRIPLQHRDGNGLVYSARFISDDAALEQLQAGLEGEPLADPRLIKFQTGRRRTFWKKNCIAIGLSAGFLEPLESTSIMLIQNAITRLQYLFPDKDFADADRDAYNMAMVQEYETVRDFLILHYKVGSRRDSDLWRSCADMAIPDTLRHRINLFESRGRIPPERGEQFRTPSWLAVMWGQGLRPRAPDPLVRNISSHDTSRWLAEMKDVVARCCDYMPSHETFLAQNGLTDTR